MKVVVLIICLVFSTTAMCGSIDSERALAEKALVDGDSKRFLEIITRLAETGDAESQSLLGQYYARVGDMILAEKWFSLTIQSTDPEIQVRLARYYLEYTDDTNHETAKKLLKKSASQGNRNAASILQVIEGNGPRLPEIVNGKIKTSELISYVNNLTSQHLEGNPGFISCFQLTVKQYDAIKRDVFKSCESKTNSSYSTLLEQSEVNLVGASHGECIRKTFQKINGVSNIDLIDCNKNVNKKLATDAKDTQ